MQLSPSNNCKWTFRSPYRLSRNPNSNPPTHRYQINGTQIQNFNAKTVILEISQKEQELNEQADIHIGLYADNNSLFGKCEYICLTPWKNLVQLTLEGQNIGNEGCRQLAKGNWKRLKWLCLDQNNIREKGCRHLAQADWSNMEDLCIRYNWIGKEGDRFLRARFVNCEITSDKDYDTRWNP